MHRPLTKRHAREIAAKREQFGCPTTAQIVFIAAVAFGLGALTAIAGGM